MKVWLTRLLVAFAIFTLGFGLGKAAGRRADGRAPLPALPSPSVAPAASVVGPVKVLVYYLHGTFRCATCNGIERQAADVVRRGFAAAVAAGRVEWRTANFQERTDLARRYEIAASTVVVVQLRGDHEVAFRRLDDVWTKYGAPAEFEDYVAGAIRAYLPTEAAP